MVNLPLHVVVISYPSQGHVMPLMEVCYKLVDHGVKVTFVNTESIHNKLVAGFPSNKETTAGSVDDQLLRLVSISDGWGEAGRKASSDQLEAIISEINKDSDGDAVETNKISCVIADLATWWALEVAEKMGVKQRAIFSTTSLAVLAMSIHIPRLVEEGIVDENGATLKHDEMIQISPTMHPINIKEFIWNCTEDPNMGKVLFRFISMTNKAVKAANLILSNTVYELERGACDAIPNMVLPIGPLVPRTNRVSQPVAHLLPEDSTCLTWLDQQPVNSVIYVAFGSIMNLNQEQFNELAHGLELTGRPFLWVVRPTDRSINTYPDGFKENKQGMIVDWAPQQKILAHPSMACFITHCGWNSILDSFLGRGVPFLCWPGFTDHFHNRTYVCDVWKVGINLDKDGNGIISRNEIKSKVDELIGDEGLKTRVLETKEMTVKSVSEGGSSWKNFQTFIEALKH